MLEGRNGTPRKRQNNRREPESGVTPTSLARLKFPRSGARHRRRCSAAAEARSRMAVSTDSPRRLPRSAPALLNFAQHQHLRNSEGLNPSSRCGCHGMSKGFRQKEREHRTCYRKLERMRVMANIARNE